MNKLLSLLLTVPRDNLISVKFITPTIQEFINQDKVVLNSFFSDFSKIRYHNLYCAIQELKHHGSIYILPCHSSKPHISLPYMKKACSGNVCDRRANLTSSVDDIHTEGIHCISTKNRQCKENGCQKCYQKTLLHLISSPNFPIQIIVSIQSSIQMKRHSLSL